MFRNLKFFSIFIILVTGCLTRGFSQITSVNFYGVFSRDADQNMLSMTEDMFVKQLNELLPGSNDLRKEKDKIFSSSDLIEDEQQINEFYSLNSSRNIFFACVSRQDETSGTWNCKLFLHTAQNKNYTVKKEFNSYYKIMMESKGIISELIEKADNKLTQPPDQKSSRPVDILTTETLAGTWTGETYINKIVIMRGGRGFVIFNNGASMNINVKVSNSAGEKSVKITQAGSSNASYFPDIPRKAALELATYAKPIEWNLKYNQDGSLSGEKSTVIMNDQESTVQAEVPVRWIKK